MIDRVSVDCWSKCAEFNVHLQESRSSGVSCFEGRLNVICKSVYSNKTVSSAYGAFSHKWVKNYILTFSNIPSDIQRLLVLVTGMIKISIKSDSQLQAMDRINCLVRYEIELGRRKVWTALSCY